MRSAGADGIDLGNDAGELAARALNLHAGLDDVLHRGNADAFARPRDVKAGGLHACLHVVILINEGLDRFSVNEKRAVFYLAFV